MNKKHFLLGFFFGGVTLSACALLAAPAAGRETRQMLKEQTKVWLQHLREVNESLQELNRSLKSTTVESVEIMKDFLSDVSAALIQWKREIGPHQEQIKKEIEAIEMSIKTLESQLKNHIAETSENSTE